MNIGANIRKLTLLFLALFIALSTGLVYWQVVAAQKVTANVHNGRRCLTNTSPLRGNIYDRNGVLLAYSEPSNGVCGYLRHYTEPSLAGLIGYYISPLYPATGIEAQFDDELSGRKGMTSLDNTVNQVLHRPPVGNDIYLTIDVRIQRIANKHFDDRPDQTEINKGNAFISNRGSIIVMNPQSGEVLAMVSRPNYDPNKLVNTLGHGDLTYFNALNKDKDKPLRERPIQETYVPGSTYKTLTLLAGLDSGKTTLDQQWSKEQSLGPITYNGQRIGPIGNNIEGYTKTFPVNTEYGFTHSDNIIFAQIGVNTGRDAWMDYNKRFYVGQQIPFDLPVTPSSVLLKPDQQLADNELAANAFGQGYDAVTPLQMALFDNTIAADGKLMKPMVVSMITEHHSDRNNHPNDKNPIETRNPTQLSTPVSQQTATQARQAMFGVVRCGSGSIVAQLFTSKSSIIGKTGTGQVSDNGSIPAMGWMITQAPYSVNNPTQLPALTIVAMKENAGEGGASVGPAIAGIYNDVFSQNIVNTQLPQVPGLDYCFQTGLLQ